MSERLASWWEWLRVRAVRLRSWWARVGVRLPRVHAWAPAVLYMALIFGLSSLHVVSPVVSIFPFRDKGAHFTEYALLGLLCARACRLTWRRRPWPRMLALGAFLATAWGLSDELHQVFVPGRSADARDLLADALGAVTGALLYEALRRRRGR